MCTRMRILSRLVRAGVLTLFGAVSARSEVSRGFLYCPCGSTGRGYATGTATILDDAINSARRAASEEGGVRASFKATARTLGGAMAACARKYKLEACVNYDAERYGVFCTHIHRHALLLQPNGTMTRAPLCNSTADFRSEPWALGLVPEPTLEPMATPEETMEPTPIASIESVSEAEPGISSTNTNATTLEKSVDANVMNEGCVALEHLKGAVLLHRRHRLARVLCARGFCATPNHEIIVRGVGRTCMRELCADNEGWSCLQTMKLVNNIRASVHKSWYVNDDITVTPFDVRYPKWMIVVAQCLEGWMITAYKGVEIVRDLLSTTVHWDNVRHMSEL